MRVQGSKQRVHLTEVDLEPSEAKPMLRIAPAAASLIWLGSIALATAIYMEWLPARALFDTETRAARERMPRSSGESRRRAPERQGPDAPRAARRAAPAAVPVAPPETVTQAPVSARASGDAAALPHETTIATPAVVPESSRTIRGSYYSDDSNWAGGW